MQILGVGAVVVVIVACAIIVHKGLKITGFDADGVYGCVMLSFFGIVGVGVAIQGMSSGDWLPVIILSLVIAGVVSYVVRTDRRLTREQAEREADPGYRALHRRLTTEGYRCAKTPCPFCDGDETE